MMESPEFLPFSDALMASFASRPQDWTEWEIREVHEHDHEVRGASHESPQQQPVRTQLQVAACLVLMNSAHPVIHRWVGDPSRASPSQVATELLKKNSLEPEMAGFHLRGWESEPARRWKTSLETELLRNPSAFMTRLSTHLSKLPSQYEWNAKGIIRDQRVRNSRGLSLQLTDTEVTVRIGPRVLYSASAFDEKLFQQKLKAFGL